jgi:hypothetical protein
MKGTKDEGEERKKYILRQVRFYSHKEKDIDFISCLISINFKYSLLFSAFSQREKTLLSALCLSVCTLSTPPV